jgi:hypothetical protein
MHQYDICRDPEEPGLERRPVAQSAHSAVDLQKYFLRKIFGISDILYAPQAQAVYRAPVFAV